MVVKHTSPRRGGAEAQGASQRFLLESFLTREQHRTVLYNDVREELTGQRSVCRRRMSAELLWSSKDPGTFSFSDEFVRRAESDHNIVVSLQIIFITSLTEQKLNDSEIVVIPFYICSILNYKRSAGEFLNHNKTADIRNMRSLAAFTSSWIKWDFFGFEIYNRTSYF